MYGDCLIDEPGEHDFPFAFLLPGVMYDGDYQCKQITNNKHAQMCDTGVVSTN